MGRLQEIKCFRCPSIGAQTLNEGCCPILELAVDDLGKFLLYTLMPAFPFDAADTLLDSLNVNQRPARGVFHDLMWTHLLDERLELNITRCVIIAIVHSLFDIITVYW